jgi:hypothetical protein
MTIQTMTLEEEFQCDLTDAVYGFQIDTNELMVKFCDTFGKSLEDAKEYIVDHPGILQTFVDHNYA